MDSKRYISLALGYAESSQGTASHWSLVEAMARADKNLRTRYVDRLLLLSTKWMAEGRCDALVRAFLPRASSDIGSQMSTQVARFGEVSEATIKGVLFATLQQAVKAGTLALSHREVVKDVLALQMDLSMAELVAFIPRELFQTDKWFKICQKSGPGAVKLREMIMSNFRPDEQDTLKAIPPPVPAVAAPASDLEPDAVRPLEEESSHPLHSYTTYQVIGKINDKGKTEDERMGYESADALPLDGPQREAWNRLVEDSKVLRDLLKDTQGENPTTTLCVPMSRTALKWILDHYSGKRVLTGAMVFDPLDNKNDNKILAIKYSLL